MPYSDHKNVLLARIVRGQNSHDETDGFVEDDKNGSVMNNEDSICFNYSEGANVYHGNSYDNDTTDKEREGMLENSLKNLGNLSCKPLLRYATTDLFVHGKQVLHKNIHKSGSTDIAKLQRKRNMILDSIKYFSVQMEHRREQLVKCSTRSADVNTVYTIPSWKQSYKQYMR
jgi:hypothetical protein